MSEPFLEQSEVVEQIRQSRLIAILRGLTEAQALAAGQALTAGGIRVLEVSLVDQAAVASIRTLRQALAGRCVVGAGTVVSVAQAEAAIDAGAQFLFSPGLNPQVQAVAQSRRLLAIPGVLTPSEITAALNLGAPLVKLFPAEPLGPRYLRQLLGPFPQLEAIATGGVGVQNAGEYLDAGAVALGLGSNIADAAWARAGNYNRFEEAAATFLRLLAVQKEGRT